MEEGVRFSGFSGFSGFLGFLGFSGWRDTVWYLSGEIASQNSRMKGIKFRVLDLNHSVDCMVQG